MSAELALALPTVVVTALVVLAFGSAGASGVQACNLARAAARAQAIGQALPHAGGMELSVQAGANSVRATAVKQLPGPLKAMGVIAKCSAEAPREPTL
ncbi:hypothetical protein HMPREF3152_09190 [Actinomyces sp. HMSC06A08]|uniref:hypothetical protein n=1 Tax=Winkia neuii TaxID=33007 RepID=UPI0003FFEF18|nr:hypothetical protein [Winkia neuii]OFT54634.1 hypothetical protein HMPREF3152_09190 [Actinomyces sp. HMSC06A08]